ncbi:hypothetical protein DPPLL_29300 [Desulfofustis limnaeus]|uniref:Uncharacterized protein n=1 Tax=Desulfofustis limnaeus TaxID=2740163 RepID=A0ABN6M6W8_9BACT|nr:hypothetical protein DPPLL_29300 [Desulfofustis limnaeus]
MNGKYPAVRQAEIGEEPFVSADQRGWFEWFGKLHDLDWNFGIASAINDVCYRLILDETALAVSCVLPSPPKAAPV